MRTKYDVGAKVWFFSTIDEKVISAEIVMVIITGEEINYRVRIEENKEVIIPENRLFSAKEAVIAYYRGMFGDTGRKW